MTALLVVAILVLLIVVHELGHFAAAKWFGIRVEEFGIGYPPRALTLGKIGDTEYTVNWIPFGGFVRLFGDEGEKQHGSGALMDASRGVRAMVLVAGVAMNVLMGWALFTYALHLGVPRAVDESTPGAYLLITNVVAGSPAEAAGLAEGDRVVAVTAQDATLADLTPGTVSDFISARAGKQVSITYMRTGVTSTVVARPANAIIPDEASRPALGVGLALVSDAPLSWGSSALAAFGSVRDAFTAVVGGLWTMLADTFHGKSAVADVVGPVGLVKVVGDAAKHGFGNVLALAAFISVNLAVINLIPIPALDGGRIFLLGFEAIFRKDAPRLFVQILNIIGVACILLLMIVVTYHDIARLFA